MTSLLKYLLSDEHGGLDSVFKFSDLYPVYNRAMITTNDQEWICKIVAPGFEKDELIVEIIADELIINGKNADAHFSQQITITNKQYNVEQITATLRNGILTITIPKLKATQPKPNRIKIND